MLIVEHYILQLSPPQTDPTNRQNRFALSDKATKSPNFHKKIRNIKTLFRFANFDFIYYLINKS